MKRYQKILWLLAYVLVLNCFTGQVRIRIGPNVGAQFYYGQSEEFAMIKICDSVGKPCQEISMKMFGDSAILITGDTMRLIRQSLIFMQQSFEKQMKGIVLIVDDDTSKWYNGDTVRVYSSIPNVVELRT